MLPYPSEGDALKKERKTKNPGDPITRLYEAHAANVLGLLVRLSGGNRAEAEDLLQETFVAAFQGQSQYTRRGSERAWLMGIAVRRWRDRVRRPRVATAGFLDEDDTRLESGASSVEQQVESRVMLDWALEKLDPRHREALLLVTGQGLSQKEVAEILEEPLGTVKWRIFEATRLVRQFLTAMEKEKEEASDVYVGKLSECAETKA